MTVPQFQATVSALPADHWEFDSTELLEATITATRLRRPELVATPAVLRFETTIPRQVGLSGSSAIIMATLRALANRAETSWDPVELARLTLEVETEILGWTAGPQDRVVQAYEGLVDMDFATPWDAASYQRLDTDRLPPLFVAWDQSTGEASTVTHSNVRQRWLDGDAIVHTAMGRFAELAAEGRAALDANAAAAQWPDLLDEAFSLRSSIWTITDIDTALIEAGRSAGAGVAFAGSGGAVVGSVESPERLDQIGRAYEAIGAGFLVLHAGKHS